jgi:hypothetical protein
MRVNVRMKTTNTRDRLNIILKNHKKIKTHRMKRNTKEREDGTHEEGESTHVALHHKQSV